MTTPNREAYRTALAWLYALKNNDSEGLVALATDTHRNHARTVAAMTDMFLGLANISTNGDPGAYLDHVRDNLDDYLDRYEEKES